MNYELRDIVWYSISNHLLITYSCQVDVIGESDREDIEATVHNAQGTGNER